MPKKTIGNLEERPLGETFFRAWRESFYPYVTIEEAAAMIGVDRTHLGKIERREQPYNQRILEATAEAYGIQPADLLGRGPDSPSIDALLRGETDALRERIFNLAISVIKEAHDARDSNIVNESSEAPDPASPAAQKEPLARALKAGGKQPKSRLGHQRQKTATRAGKQVDRKD